VGISGLEAEWDGYLEPQVGFVQGERDAVGNAISLASEKTIEAKRGSSIYTTIDKKLQNIVERDLKRAITKYKAKSGTVIIMDPKTGYIMALANYPDYDPNLREEKDPEAYGNKAVGEPYEVGSVGKVLTLAAAVDAGVVKPGSVILKNGHEGCEKIHKDLNKVCTHDSLPQPAISIAQAFALSDNIYFLHLGDILEKSSPGIFSEYLDKFGIGKPAGIDISGESFGYLKDWKLWNIGDIAAYSYGHSYQVNAIQVISSVAAVANYGTRMQPKLIKKIVEDDGTTIEFKPVPVAQVVKPTTTKHMDMMMGIIYQNTIGYYPWEYSHLGEYKIAMKSGTALIPNNIGGYSNRINATYVGYDATPCRTFIMLTRLEDPKVGDLASQNSGFLWMDVFNDVRDHIGVPKKGECRN
jgi:cell division protein FtsI (penicillin-binding protein 3)